MLYNEPLSNELSSRTPKASQILRLRIVLVFFGLLFAGVLYHLVKLQVVEHDLYIGKAKKQYEARQDLPATRGSICDRNGTVIASNTLLCSYVADPKSVADSVRKHIADVFAKSFGTPKEFFLNKMKPNLHFVWLARLVDPETLKCPLPDKMPGLTVYKEPKRLYYQKTVAGQLIGTTDIDNKGIMGLELALNENLEGKGGYVIKQRDGLGGERVEVEYPRIDPVSGNTTYLTIDLGLQYIAEEELRLGVEKNKADGGLVIMMNPKTGELLAVAQYPPLDPSDPSSCDQKDQKLKIVTDRVEPGSVFKIVTASAAIENHLVSLDQEFYAENGKWNIPIGHGKIRTIADDEPHGMLTIRGAMTHSSNIVMAKISNIIGAERFYKMARSYGFGNPTNVGLPGEIRGLLKKPSEWSGTTLNTMAFGYEVGVTPLQLICAYSVVANGGYLMRPYIIDKVVDPNGKLVSETNPQTIRRVISPSTVATMTALFEGVVDSGTATAAQIAGLRIAGKTGTAHRNVNGHYEKGKYTASFVGFYPVEDPKIICLVMLDNPHGGAYYGGLTSAPVFKSIAERVITTTDVLGSITLPEPVMAKNTTKQNTIEPKPVHSIVKTLKADSMLIPLIDQHSPEDRVVPDLQGFSVRKAIGLLSNWQLDATVEGVGVVISQDPAAGTVVRPGTKVMLKCEAKVLSDESQGMN